MPHWCPPNAESPFASLRCYLAEGDICCYLNRHCPVLFAHTGSWARPKSSFRLQLSLLRKVFADCCQSLLEDGPSRRYLRIPCIGAWTPTPPRPSGAYACFFPECIGLTSRFTSSAREKFPCNATSTGERFRGCSHSVMFRLPCLLGPPVAPTAVSLAHRAAGPFTPRNGRVVPYTNCGIATYPNQAIGMVGLAPTGMRPCRPLPCRFAPSFLTSDERYNLT